MTCGEYDQKVIVTSRQNSPSREPLRPGIPRPCNKLRKHRYRCGNYYQAPNPGPETYSPPLHQRTNAGHSGKYQKVHDSGEGRISRKHASSKAAVRSPGEIQVPNVCPSWHGGEARPLHGCMKVEAPLKDRRKYKCLLYERWCFC